MFSHLFNTYEAVAPPPKSHKDFEKEIYQEPEDDMRFFEPLGIGPISVLPEVNKPSEEPFIANIPKPIILEDEDHESQYSSSNQLVNNIISTGRSFVGGKYVSGGTSPETGFDCSGFLQYIFKQNGVDIPRDTKGIFKVGKEVSLSNVQPGDIICSRGNGPSGRHVQMVSRVDPQDNQIYVIEAKGRKWGITEGLLTKKVSDIISVRRVLNSNPTDPLATNQDIKSPSTRTSFSTRKEFAETLTASYKRALSQHNLDPNYAYILTAQAAIESGWGRKQSGKYNFGGIKAGKNQPGTYKTTTDWSPTRGYYRNVQKFRDFTSIDDYCNFRIKLLGNSRYNIFNQFSPNQPYDIVYHMLKKGYGSDNGGSASVKYARDASKIYNSILRMTQKS